MSGVVHSPYKCNIRKTDSYTSNGIKRYKRETNNIMENAILTLYHGMAMANFYIAHNLNLHGT